MSCYRHVSLVKIQGKEFEFEPIRLRSVRPFLFEEFSLAAAHDPENKVNLNSKVAVNKYLKGRVSRCLVVAIESERRSPHAESGQRAHREGERGMGRTSSR